MFTSELSTIPLQPAFEDYVFMLDDACAAWGFGPSDECGIVALMGDVGLNAFATTCDGTPAIVYNRKLTSIVGGDGAEFVVAHELGHHFCRHIAHGPVDAKANFARELEADRFAGATMRMMGRSLEATLLVTRVLAPDSGESHPTKKARVAAITEGWNKPETALSCRMATP